MAKTSAVEKNKRREKLVKRHAGKRARLKAIVMDQGLPLEERFRATIRTQTYATPYQLDLTMPGT